MAGGRHLGVLLVSHSVGQDGKEDPGTVKPGHRRADIVIGDPAGPVPHEVAGKKFVELVVVAGDQAGGRKELPEPTSPLLAIGDVTGAVGGEVPFFSPEPGRHQIVSGRHSEFGQPSTEGLAGGAPVVDERVVEVENYASDLPAPGNAGGGDRGKGGSPRPGRQPTDP